MSRHRARFLIGVAAACRRVRSGDSGAAPGSATRRPKAKPESVTVVAGQHYEAGRFHRWLLGANYRDLWTTPIRVPVFDWHTFAGGLHPTKEGGGNQTKSLRFETAEGDEYVFRLVDKTVSGP